MRSPPAASLPAGLQVDDYLPSRRSLRIAVVTETYPPEVNGVAVTLAQVVEELRRRGHVLQLVRPGQLARSGSGDEPDAEEGGFHEVLMRGLPIPRYPQLRMGLPSKKALVALWTLRRPDVVHIATEGPLGWSALEAARRLKLPVCSDFRTNFHAYSKHYGIGWLHKPIVAYLRKFHNRTHCTMVPTERLQRDLAAYGFLNLNVIARGVDTELFHPRKRSEALRASWGCGPGSRVVLAVGRLAPEKNLGVLLTAFEAMRRCDPALKLVLVGDGPMRRELQQRCPDAVFAGQRSGEDLAAHYASGDLFLFPSVSETFGNVTPEAMASGLVVLAYQYAAAAQLIRHGENGLLAAFDQAPGFVHLACSLAQQPDRLPAMAQQARLTACEQGWGRIVDQIEAVYLGSMRSGPVLRATLAQQVRPAG